MDIIQPIFSTIDVSPSSYRNPLYDPTSASAVNWHEIAFVDSQIDNYQSLIQGFNPNIQVVVLDSHQNGINQITQFLSSQNYQLS
ncbi:MAG: DUF4347 domain-containing protein, partial [Sphaerospermopsis kisseleviana]